MYIINHHEEHKEHEEKILTKKNLFSNGYSFVNFVNFVNFVVCNN